MEGVSEHQGGLRGTDLGGQTDRAQNADFRTVCRFSTDSPPPLLSDPPVPMGGGTLQRAVGPDPHLGLSTSMGDAQSRRKRTLTHEWVHEWHHEWTREWTHECAHEISHESSHDRTHEG